MYVNESVPLASGAGVYVSAGAAPERVPRTAAVATTNVIGSPSGSLPARVTPTGVSSAVVTRLRVDHVGGWLAVTLTLIAPVLQRGSGWPFVVPLSQTV